MNNDEGQVIRLSAGAVAAVLISGCGNCSHLWFAFGIQHGAWRGFRG